MTLKINALETRRFGMVCAGIDGMASQLPDLAEVNRQAQMQGVAMISVRVDVSALDRVHTLEADGYRLMDTLVYYNGNLAQDRPALSLPTGISFRVATPQDAEAVGSLARLCFKNYIGHYHSDPRLDSKAADAAYAEWAERSVRQVSARDPVFLVLQGDDIAGFLTTRTRADDAHEFVLNGVAPEYQGRGLYAALLNAAARMIDAEAQGQEPQALLSISTQINNYGVQRVWARMGLVHSQSFYTFHKWFTL
ncbi:GNAT family N-acetyltransferase (plasmid) [Pseudorhodobacter turbinis]|uniref:GNAT family N-acetyltransferase n=1 Tax=Pseudorhodobacter turbinis TaxID=2500533 RepID=A0A4P8ELZ8_9RHOB|nr:GNAT family N-acetyltransferase [Pseudorhodobacter turbinis]QCO58126.1 GNAT family N-acetyltransferase [Pseudorhodobacter turbinis]